MLRLIVFCTRLIDWFYFIHRGGNILMGSWNISIKLGLQKQHIHSPAIIKPLIESEFATLRASWIDLKQTWERSFSFFIIVQTANYDWSFVNTRIVSGSICGPSHNSTIGSWPTILDVDAIAESQKSDVDFADINRTGTICCSFIISPSNSIAFFSSFRPPPPPPPPATH